MVTDTQIVFRGIDHSRAVEDIYVAIRDAFNALERQIKSIYEKRRHQDRSTPKPADTLQVSEEP
jgi:ribosome-associated translation inhibitor RaiA